MRKADAFASAVGTQQTALDGFVVNPTGETFKPFRLFRFPIGNSAQTAS